MRAKSIVITIMSTAVVAMSPTTPVCQSPNKLPIAARALLNDEGHEQEEGGAEHH